MKTSKHFWSGRQSDVTCYFLFVVSLKFKKFFIKRPDKSAAQIATNITDL